MEYYLSFADLKPIRACKNAPDGSENAVWSVLPPSTQDTFSLTLDGEACLNERRSVRNMSVTPASVSEEALRAISIISQWPRLQLGNWPSPIERVRHPAFGELLVKRDDLAGFGRCGASGVKARKLESFLAYLHQRRCAQLILLLANMTNLAHDIAPLLNQLGIGLRLLILNDPPLDSTQRELLFKDISGSIEFLGANRLAAMIRLGAVAGQAKVSGLRTMALLPSPGHPTAVIGAARGFLEMVQQLQAAEQALPASVFISAAAGTTVAGFILAGSLIQAAGIGKIRIVVVPVMPYRLEYWLPILLSWTRRTIGLRGHFPVADYRILRLKRNLIYGRFDNFLENVCKRVLDSFELTLDPVYGGKSWSAMEEYMESARERGNNPVMFWHCGYSPDWRVFRVGSACS